MQLYSISRVLLDNVDRAGELAQMVERSLSMREVPGSIPGFSNPSFLFLFFPNNPDIFLMLFSSIKCPFFFQKFFFINHHILKIFFTFDCGAFCIALYKNETNKIVT